MFIVMLEGKDPARTKKLLEALLEEFKNLATDENRDKIDETKEYAQSRLIGLRKDLAAVDKAIYKQLKAVRIIGPGGKNIFEEHYINLGNTLSHKQMRVGELNQQLMIARSFPRADFSPDEAERRQSIAMLENEKKKWVQVLKKAQQTVRHFNTDEAAGSTHGVSRR